MHALKEGRGVSRPSEGQKLLNKVIESQTHVANMFAPLFWGTWADAGLSVCGVSRARLAHAVNGRCRGVCPQAGALG
jgi:hypothetical protein